VILRGNSRRVLFDQLKGDPYFLKRIPQGLVNNFIDIGSNVGFISMFIRFLHPYSNILSVEPHPVIYNQLNENVKNLKINSLNCALGDGSDFYLFSERKMDLCNLFSSEKKNSNLTVKSMTLNNIFKFSNFDLDDVYLKIDCEGAETILMYNEESENILRKCKFVSMELHNKDKNKGTIEELIEWFQNLLMKTHTIHIKKNSGLAANVLSIRKDIYL